MWLHFSAEPRKGRGISPPSPRQHEPKHPDACLMLRWLTVDYKLNIGV